MQSLQVLRQMTSDSPSESKAPQNAITAADSEEKSTDKPATEIGSSEPPETEATAQAPEPLSPSIAERVSVPATPSAGESTDEGGEWDLLSSKLRQWWTENDLADQWQRLRQPLMLIAGLIVFILALRIYGGILDAIATVPLAPRLFELVGVVYATWFATTQLVRSEERRKFSARFSDLLSSIRGRQST